MMNVRSNLVGFNIKRQQFISVLRGNIRNIYLGVQLLSKKIQLKKECAGNSELIELIEKYEGYKTNRKIFEKQQQHQERLKSALQFVQPVPVSLKYYLGNENVSPSEEKFRDSNTIDNSYDKNITATHFPYAFSTSSFKSVQNHDNNGELMENKVDFNTCELEVRKRYEIMQNMKNWMSGYDNYEFDLVEHDRKVELDGEVNYGTPDSKSPVSNVPCGGCGALLHCKDTAIPGYIPSEIFKNYNRKGAAHLNAIVCQRCYFLREFNIALQVQISSEDYINVLKTIQNKKALVVLLIDLMDFPCSIWPGISDILGSKTPIVVVGNKVDLLPKDDTKYLTRIKRTLIDNLKLHGFATSNIREVVLISAKTGYGIEELITKLHCIWKYNGDVYLVGCTNVGKSSLFNILLQSDYCKSQASDLIQRATTSLWPGTTLNLLKFPILRPSDHKLYMRFQRMKLENQIAAKEKKLEVTNSNNNQTLIGHIGRTFIKSPDIKNSGDSFSVAGNSNGSGRMTMGINEKLPEYMMSRWCYDTPGVIQPDQILHLLTTEELVLTLPKTVIRPETFCVKPGTSLFLAGLARLDYVDGPGSIRLTVFRSNELPITICDMDDSDGNYNELLGTELFKVPINNHERLSKWPGIEMAKCFILTGKHWKESSEDIVLSSAGWVAVNCAPNKQFKFQAWTPEKRGVYLRDCLLPKAVTLRGSRIRYSVAYKC